MISRIALAFGLLLGAAGGVAAQDRVEVGVMECNVAGGFGFIVGSSKDVGCTYRPAGGGPAEHYAGTINKFGIDIGETAETTIVWAVLAPTAQIGPGALAGTYVGVSAEATAGVGLGANALIGGGNSIALNPISVQAQTGVNIAAGVAELTLRPAR